MSLNPLDNPLERLGVLPNGMNWRGGWDVNEQYYLNDVVISPATTASFILSGPTTLRGGADPSLNPDWTELSNPTTGVVSVSGSTYIGIGGTPTNPQIINNGVRAMTFGTGIANVGTANNPSLVNTGITSLSAGLGISVLGNTITNDGIRSISVNPAGLSYSGGNTPSLANTGVLSVLVNPAGLATTGGQNPTLTNTGLLGLTALNAGSGISIGGTATTPIISATGARPLLTNIVASINIIPDPATLPCPPAGTAVYAMALSSPTIFSNQLAAGAPDPNGVWLMDFSNFDLYLYGVPSIGVARNLSISFVDTGTLGGPYTYVPTGGTIQFYPNQPVPVNADMGAIVFDVAAARATGMRTITEIHIFNNTNATLDPQGWGSVWATYYPDGPQ